MLPKDVFSSVASTLTDRTVFSSNMTMNCPSCLAMPLMNSGRMAAPKVGVGSIISSVMPTTSLTASTMMPMSVTWPEWSPAKSRVSTITMLVCLSRVKAGIALAWRVFAGWPQGFLWIPFVVLYSFYLSGKFKNAISSNIHSRNGMGSVHLSVNVKILEVEGYMVYLIREHLSRFECCYCLPPLSFAQSSQWTGTIHLTLDCYPGWLRLSGDWHISSCNL